MITNCTVPPRGWYCTREPGHEGPCAAHSVTGAEARADRPLPLTYYQWLATIEPDVRVRDLTADEIAGLLAALQPSTTAPEALLEALCRSQSVLDRIVQSNSTCMAEVREQVMFNRAALTAYRTTQGEGG